MRSSIKYGRITRMRHHHLCLLIVALMTAGCGLLPQPPAPSTKPLLDQALAAPCKANGLPKLANDYDSWQEWVEEVVLKNYADCALRKQGIVEAWPK